MVCRLYCRQYSDFHEIIANKVIDMISTSKRRRIYPLSEDLKEKLMSIAKDGLLIDFSNIIKTDRTIEIPIYCIGKFINMDDMYNDLERHISHSKYSARLIQRNRRWAIDYVIEK